MVLPWRHAGVFDRVLRRFQAQANAQETLTGTCTLYASTSTPPGLAGPAPLGEGIRSRELVKCSGAAKAGSRSSDICVPRAAVTRSGRCHALAKGAHACVQAERPEIGATPVTSRPPQTAPDQAGDPDPRGSTASTRFRQELSLGA